MKAILYNKTHSHEPFYLAELPNPEMAEDRVLVKIHAASLNAADYRSMSLGIIPKSRIFGGDIAGTVVETGSAVRDFKIGDRVFGDIISAGWGGLAEYVAVPEKILVLIPDTVSFNDAAALPIAGITALQGLRKWTDIKPGQKVLVYGAGGGVGNFTVQIAKVLGAHVTAVCGTHNIELIKTLGADEVLDYTKTNPLKQKEMFNLVCAINGRNPLNAYLKTLVPGGTLVVEGGHLTQVTAAMLLGPILSTGSKKIHLLAAKPDRGDLEFLASLVAEGKLKPVIDRVFPLEEAPQAMQYLQQGHSRGKVVIQVI